MNVWINVWMMCGCMCGMNARIPCNVGRTQPAADSLTFSRQRSSLASGVPRTVSSMASGTSPPAPPSPNRRSARRGVAVLAINAVGFADAAQQLSDGLLTQAGTSQESGKHEPPVSGCVALSGCAVYCYGKQGGWGLSGLAWSGISQKALPQGGAYVCAHVCLCGNEVF